MRTLEELEENERPLFECFGDAQYVEKLLNFLALEEQKGRDKFQMKHLTLFKVEAGRKLTDLTFSVLFIEKNDRVTLTWKLA